ncbi:MAG: SGNH/GDSL hydrolase family protein [Clostridia bacterium]|nr:SGNH/GDSL hydrolase family protein [Clostridia bacterium]
MAEFKIESIDKNLVVSDKINAPDLALYDVRKPPFEIYGLYQPTTEPAFKRMPDNVAATVNSGVKRLARHTAGGRVRFSTDSPYVVLKAVMPSITHFSHMPLTGTSGFDIYIDSPDGTESLYHRTFVPPHGMTDGYESMIEFYEPGIHYVTIHLPLYNTLSELYIGVKEGSTLGAGAPYRPLAPIVYYGSSITQGGCASRPGNGFTNMVSRALNIDHVNLGFSGSGKGEETMVDYLASLEMSAFVSDYDHNAPDAAHLRATHQRLYDRIREKHPDIPYLILSKPDFYRDAPPYDNFQKNVDRRRVTVDTYHYARDKGDRNVYYIDGQSIFRGPYEDSCTVDGAHPNDLGFSYMADAIECVLRRVLRDGKM